MKVWEYIRMAEEGYECFCGGVFVEKDERTLVCCKCGFRIVTIGDTE